MTLHCPNGVTRWLKHLNGCFEKGRLARLEGQLRPDCPYKGYNNIERQRRLAWLDGWERAFNSLALELLPSGVLRPLTERQTPFAMKRLVKETTPTGDDYSRIRYEEFVEHYGARPRFTFPATTGKLPGHLFAGHPADASPRPTFNLLGTVSGRRPCS